MTFRASIALLFAVVSFWQAAQAADLPRRPLLGIVAGNLSEKERDAAGLSALEGVAALQVVPGSAAEQAGVKAGDLVLAVDARPVGSSAELIGAVRTHAAGQGIVITVRRAGKPLDIPVLLAGLPYESSPDFDVLYEAVSTDEGARRVIITRPHGGNTAPGWPAVLLIGGIGAFSVDAALRPEDPYRQLLYSLTRRGFVTMRVEKSGVGDSEGPPNAQASLDTEFAGYLAGLRMLKAKPYVDPRRTFIVGHSIGSIEAPLAASRETVRGIVVMEGVGTTWFEYELANLRHQLMLQGLPPAQIADRLRLKEWAMHRLVVEKQSRDSILKERPEAAAAIDYPASDTYMQQASAYNLPGLWMKPEGDVLVVHGSADFIASASESRAIAEAVNSFHPGHADLVEIEGMDHYLTHMGSEAEAWKRRPSIRAADDKPAYDLQLNEVIGAWLSARTAG